MTRDDVIRMAAAAGAGRMMTLRTADEQRWAGLLPPEVLERFAALVAAAEREACATACDTLAAGYALPSSDPTDAAAEVACESCAEAIRARSVA